MEEEQGFDEYNIEFKNDIGDDEIEQRVVLNGFQQVLISYQPVNTRERVEIQFPEHDTNQQQDFKAINPYYTFDRLVTFQNALYSILVDGNNITIQRKCFVFDGKNKAKQILPNLSADGVQQFLQYSVTFNFSVNVGPNIGFFEKEQTFYLLAPTINGYLYVQSLETYDIKSIQEQPDNTNKRKIIPLGIPNGAFLTSFHVALESDYEFTIGVLTNQGNCLKVNFSQKDLMLNSSEWLAPNDKSRQQEIKQGDIGNGIINFFKRGNNSGSHFSEICFVSNRFLIGVSDNFTLTLINLNKGPQPIFKSEFLQNLHQQLKASIGGAANLSSNSTSANTANLNFGSALSHQNFSFKIKSLSWNPIINKDDKRADDAINLLVLISVTSRYFQNSISLFNLRLGISRDDIEIDSQGVNWAATKIDSVATNLDFESITLTEELTFFLEGKNRKKYLASPFLLSDYPHSFILKQGLFLKLTLISWKSKKADGRNKIHFFDFQNFHKNNVTELTLISEIASIDNLLDLELIEDEYFLQKFDPNINLIDPNHIFDRIFLPDRFPLEIIQQQLNQKSNKLDFIQDFINKHKIQLLNNTQSAIKFLGDFIRRLTLKTKKRLEARALCVQDDSSSLVFIQRTNGITAVIPTCEYQVLGSVLQSTILSSKIQLHRDILEFSIPVAEISQTFLEILENNSCKTTVLTQRKDQSYEQYFHFLQIIKLYFLPVVQSLNILEDIQWKEDESNIHRFLEKQIVQLIEICHSHLDPQTSTRISDLIENSQVQHIQIHLAQTLNAIQTYFTSSEQAGLNINNRPDKAAEYEEVISSLIINLLAGSVRQRFSELSDLYLINYIGVALLQYRGLQYSENIDKHYNFDHFMNTRKLTLLYEKPSYMVKDQKRMIMQLSTDHKRKLYNDVVFNFILDQSYYCIGSQLYKILNFSQDWFRDAFERSSDGILFGFNLVGENIEITKELFIQNIQCNVIEYLKEKEYNSHLKYFLKFSSNDPYFLFNQVSIYLDEGNETKAYQKLESIGAILIDFQIENFHKLGPWHQYFEQNSNLEEESIKNFISIFRKNQNLHQVIQSHVNIQDYSIILQFHFFMIKYFGEIQDSSRVNDELFYSTLKKLISKIGSAGLNLTTNESSSATIFFIKNIIDCESENIDNIVFLLEKLKSTVVIELSYFSLKFSNIFSLSKPIIQPRMKLENNRVYFSSIISMLSKLDLDKLAAYSLDEVYSCALNQELIEIAQDDWSINYENLNQYFETASREDINQKSRYFLKTNAYQHALILESINLKYLQDILTNGKIPKGKYMEILKYLCNSLDKLLTNFQNYLDTQNCSAFCQYERLMRDEQNIKKQAKNREIWINLTKYSQNTKDTLFKFYSEHRELFNQRSENNCKFDFLILDKPLIEGILLHYEQIYTIECQRFQEHALQLKHPTEIFKLLIKEKNYKDLVLYVFSANLMEELSQLLTFFVFKLYQYQKKKNTLQVNKFFKYLNFILENSQDHIQENKLKLEIINAHLNIRDQNDKNYSSQFLEFRERINAHSISLQPIMFNFNNDDILHSIDSVQQNGRKAINEKCSDNKLQNFYLGTHAIRKIINADVTENKRHIIQILEKN